MEGRRLLIPAILLWFVAAAVAAEPDSAASSSEGLLWISPAGEIEWRVPFDPGAWPEDGARELVARRWQPRVPDVRVELIDGDPVRLRDSEAEVLVLEFWASWCAPCAIELPLLQRLQDLEKDNGLRVLALNVGDDDDLIRAYTRGMGIRLPVGRGDDLQQPLGVEGLPTVIMCDREGRILGRWEGYTESVAYEIADLARKAYDAPPGKKLADATLGGELLEIDWRREFRSPTEGVAIVPASSGGGAVLSVAGRAVRTVKADGWLEGRLDNLSAAGRLVQGDLDGDGSGDWISFRRGSPRIVLLDEGGSDARVFRAPSPILDAAILPALGSDQAGQVWLATIEGMFRSESGGEEFQPVTTVGRVEAITVASGGADSHVVALQQGGGLVRFDRAGEPRGLTELPAWAKAVGTGSMTAGAAVGRGVKSMVLGRFTARGRIEVAAVTDDGDLVLLDAADGSPVFRARWPGIHTIAAGDVDGDGLDELAVASGLDLMLVSAPAAGGVGSE